MKRNFQNRIQNGIEQCGRFLPQEVTYIDFEREEPPAPGARFCAFCRHALSEAATRGSCLQSIRSAAYQALITGEPYYFRCWIGLSSFLIPVAPHGKLTGAVEFGGFVYVADAAEELAFVRKNVARLLPGLTDRLGPRLNAVPSLSPVEARGFAEFVQDTLFSSGVNHVDEFRRRRDKYLQQRRIAELLHTTAAQPPEDREVFDLLAAVAAASQRANAAQLRLCLDDYFTRVLLLSGLKPPLIKAYVLQLLSLLFREQLRRTGEPFSAVIVRLHLALLELDTMDDMADICHWASRQVERLAGLETAAGDGALAAPLVQRVERWIEINYARRKCTLTAAARETGASVPTIVKRFRRHTGRSFHAQVTERRLREARSLLSLSDLKIAEIARRCGFGDQSHFTRAFRTAFNLSPRTFRAFGARPPATTAGPVAQPPS